MSRMHLFVPSSAFLLLATLAVRMPADPLPPPAPPINARTILVRPDPAPDADATGHIELKEHHDRNVIHVHVQHLDRGATYDVKIAKGGTTEALGSITIPPPPPPRCFRALLDSKQESPPVTTDATALARIHLDGRDRTDLHYEIKAHKLSGPPTSVDIQNAAGDVL